MSQVQSSGEAPAASLVGSLDVFSLCDVLTLLADTGQTGELQVVGSGADGRVWLDGGELSNAHVGAATTIGQAVFELACLSEGWFYFTAGLVSSSGQPRVSVRAVLDEVQPQVDEWRTIRQLVPFEAKVSLSPHPPTDDVQIRGDHWRVLTTIGSGGHSVRSILEIVGGEQITGLRALRDLSSLGLIVLDTGVSASQQYSSPPPFQMRGATNDPSAGTAEPESAAEPSRTGEVPIVPPLGGGSSTIGHLDDTGSLAELTIMPPPIASDPWESDTERGGGAESNGVA